MSPSDITTFTPNPGLALTRNDDYQALVGQFSRALGIVLSRDDAIEPNLRLGDKQAITNILKFFKWIGSHTTQEWAQGVPLTKDKIYEGCGNPHHHVHRELRDCLTKVTEGNRRRAIAATWRLSPRHLRGLAKYVAKSIAINAAATVREMEAAEQRAQDAAELHHLLDVTPEEQFAIDMAITNEQRELALQVSRDIRMNNVLLGQSEAV